jgi:hypothetical protein
MTNDIQSDIYKLEGEELSAVCFVRDYIELHFDGPILRFLGKIAVQNGQTLRLLSDKEFKDWLCRNIGKRVKSIKAPSGNIIEVKFHGNDIVRVQGEKVGYEFAHFISSPDKGMQVWEVD